MWTVGTTTSLQLTFLSGDGLTTRDEAFSDVSSDVTVAQGEALGNKIATLLNNDYVLDSIQKRNVITEQNW